jgi:hypothetical protein
LSGAPNSAEAGEVAVRRMINDRYGS